MKKSILICSTSYHQYDRRLQRISNSLSDNGHETYWISRSYDNKAKSKSQVIHIPINTYFGSGILFYLEYNIRLFWRILSTSSDLICSVDLDTLPACALATLLSKSKLAFDAHEIFYEVPELEGKLFKKWIWKTVARLFIRRSDLNYTVNSSLKKHYEQAYGKPFHVIMNVPEKSLDIEVDKNRHELKTLVYLGVINKGRGIDIAIQSLKQLPDYKLIIIGEGDESEAMRELCKENGVEDRVEFTSFVAPENIATVLKKGSIGVNLLVAESENYRLSLANKFFDYMHNHLPSVNMRYPEYENILSQNKVGLMVDDYTVQDLVEAVRMLDDFSLYYELVDNCEVFKGQYTWEREKEELVRLYKV